MDCASFLYAEPWFHFTPDNLNCFTLVLIWTKFMVFWFRLLLPSTVICCRLLWPCLVLRVHFADDKNKTFQNDIYGTKVGLNDNSERLNLDQSWKHSLIFLTIRLILIRFYVCQPSDPHKAFNKMPGSTGFKINCSPKKADLPVIRLDVMVTLI